MIDKRANKSSDVPMSGESVNMMLNKLHAMKSARIVTVKQIAKGIREGESQVSQWVMQRTRTPRAEVQKKLRTFCAKQSLRIAMDQKLAPAYRSAFNTARILFPEGERE